MADIVEKGEGAIALSPINIDSNCLTYEKDNTYISTYKYEESPEIKIFAGDIIFVKTGSTVGKVAFVDNIIDRTTLNPQLVVLKQVKCNPYFLYLLMAAPCFQKHIKRITVGGAVPTLSQNEMGRIRITLPPNAEQDRISALFKLLNYRIETQKKIIEDLKKLKDAISKSLFSCYDLLEAKMQISQIASLKNGYAFQSSSYDSSGEYEIITIANVAGDRYICTEGCNRIHTLPSDLQPHQELKDGDILISLTGNVGRVSLCKEGKYLLNQRVGLLQLKAGVNREFVYQVLSSHKFELSMISCGQGAAQMNIGKGDVESFVIPYSNNSENLQRISLILRSYDKLVLTESTRLQLLLNQKQYIISNMFI